MNKQRILEIYSQQLNDYYGCDQPAEEGEKGGYRHFLHGEGDCLPFLWDGLQVLPYPPDAHALLPLPEYLLMILFVPMTTRMPLME